MNRRRWAVVVFLLGWLAVPGIAHADPPGPTDYRTEIVGVEPAVGSIAVSVEGGDSFVRLAVDPGHEVMVLGYDGEPYLRIGRDGVVEHNLRSYATYYNEDRYGATEIPDFVDNQAVPEWERIGRGGTWAWHDHRAHWMGTEPPFGLDPGEALPVQSIPVSVDGVPVSIEVETRLVEQPSVIPVGFGLVLGLSLALLGLRLGPASTGLVALLTAGGGVVVGVAQYSSLPPETGRLVTWWLLPSIAAVAVIASIATYGRSRLVHLGLIALAVVQTGIWAFSRRSGLTRAVLPTDLPAGADRFVTAACLAASLVMLVGVVRWLFSIDPEPGGEVSSVVGS